MAYSLLLLPLLFLLMVLLHNAYCLFINWTITRKSGIPYLMIPVSPDNPVWMLIGEHVLGVIRSVFGQNTITRYTRLGWEYYDKNRLHLLHGDLVMLVSPQRNWLHLCNAEAIHDVLNRRNDFPRPAEMLGECFQTSPCRF